MGKNLLVIPIMTFLLYLGIWSNIPAFRDAIVFTYLSFIPGFALLRIVRLNELDAVDTILFSVGLSMAFSMFMGLLISELHFVGIPQPLSTTPLTMALSLPILVIFFVDYKQNSSENLSSIAAHWNETKKLIPMSAVLVLLPILGVLGALFISIPVLLILIIAIAILYALSLLSTRFVPSTLYPLLIFAISLALLFHVVFTSKFIIGFDANLEYHVFRLTQINGYWSFLNTSSNTLSTVNYNSMLSITVLPAVYSAMLNINGDIVFKVLYPFVFSLVPVVLYRIYERQTGKSDALSSALFFISGLLVFYGVTPISLNRQIVAEFFFVLSIFILLDREISIRKRRLLLTFFGAALIVSHYSLTYIYLAFVLLIYAVPRIKGNLVPADDEVLNANTVILLFALAFLWYSLAISPLTSLAQFFSVFSSNFLTDLLNPSARSTQTFLSQPTPSISNSISLGVFFIANLVLAVGIFSLIIKPQKTGFSPKYRLMSILSAIILFFCFALPNFAPSLDLDRFYGITLLILAPCFVLGFNTLSDLGKNIRRKAISQHFSENRYSRRITLLLCTILICFLLTQSGFVNRITGSSPLLRSIDSRQATVIERSSD